MKTIDRHERLEVELVEHSPGRPDTGIGRYTAELRKHLAELSEDVSVRLTSSVDPPLAKRFTTLHSLPLWVRSHQPGAIVHFTQIMGCSQMLWHPVHPAVATVHDMGGLVWPEERNMMNPLDRFLLGLSIAGLKRMDAIVAVSEFTRQGVVEYLGVAPGRVYTIHSGIDLERFHPIPEARKKLAKRYRLPGGPEARYILYVGSELPRKNLGTLLRAIALLIGEVPDVHLLKVGSAGGERFRRTTERLISDLGVMDRVHFYERVPDPDLPAFYSAADICVFPSLLEGFGFPILEASACGTPVVASDIPAFRETSSNAYAFAPATSAPAMAEAIALALRTPRAILIAPPVKQYSWCDTATRVARVYRDIVTHPRGLL